MNEGQYRGTGWAIFIVFLLIPLYMCWTHTLVMRFFLNLTLSLTDNELVQISWLLTFAVFALPGLMTKNYFVQKSWDAHVAALPKPDARDSAKRSKYVSLGNVPLSAPKPVDISGIPQGQEEFIVTCGACGHLFSARRGQKSLKCPSCDEPIPIK
jgi:hypothetical protein